MNMEESRSKVIPDASEGDRKEGLGLPAARRVLKL